MACQEKTEPQRRFFPEHTICRWGGAYDKSRGNRRSKPLRGEALVSGFLGFAEQPYIKMLRRLEWPWKSVYISTVRPSDCFRLLR